MSAPGGRTAGDGDSLPISVLFLLGGIAGLMFLVAVLAQFPHPTALVQLLYLGSVPTSLSVLVGAAISIGDSRRPGEVRGPALVFVSFAVAWALPIGILLASGGFSHSLVMYGFGYLFSLPPGMIIGSHIALAGTLRGFRGSRVPGAIALLGVAAACFLPLVMAGSVDRLLATMGEILVALMVGCDVAVVVTLWADRYASRTRPVSGPV